MNEKSARTDAYWRAYAIAAGLEQGGYDVVRFGDSDAMATALAALVLAGTKRATAGLARDFAPGGEPHPVVGGHVVLVDGQGGPCCIWRTTDIRTGPLDSVDDLFAWDEGEGDRSRAWWLSAHRRYFSDQGKREGFEVTDSIDTVFERFEVVWPPTADGVRWRGRPKLVGGDGFEPPTLSV